jgi:DNA modification methylase
VETETEVTDSYQVRLVDLNDLTPAEWNPRRISKTRFRNLYRTIAADPRMLWSRPVMAMADGTIYAGNMRDRAVEYMWQHGCPKPPSSAKFAQQVIWSEAARLAGIRPNTIPAVVEDVSEKLAKERALRDNAQWGEWVEEELEEVVSELKLEDSDLTLLGFDDQELGELDVGPADTEEGIIEDEPEMVEPDARVISKRGDVWTLGSHRLMCGDSLTFDDVAKLFNGTMPDVVIADPPYGMRLDTDFSGMESEISEGSTGNTYAPVTGDDQDFNARPLYENALLLQCPEQFWFGADYYSSSLPAEHTGAWIVWDKRVEDSSDKMFGSCFELIWSKSKHRREILRIKWAGFFGLQAEPERRRFHPNHKPMALMIALINRARGSIIYDPFSGSGSVLLASERSDRQCYSMEIEPVYCDVIMRRWIAMTGEQPIRHDGVPFNECIGEEVDEETAAA